MAEKLDEAGGRTEFQAIVKELQAARAHMRALLARVKRTHGFHRSRRALGVDVNTPVSLPFVWAGKLGVALEAVEEAIREMRAGGRPRRRG